MDFQAFLSDPTGIALQSMLGLAFLDFLLGVLAAARDGTFELDAIAAFLRKHVLGRVAPIGLLLIGTYATGGMGDNLGLSGAAIAAAGAYVLETASSLKSSIGQALAPEKAAERAEAEIADGQESVAILENPVPTE